MIGSSFSCTIKVRRDKKGMVMRMKDVKTKIGGPVGATEVERLGSESLVGHGRRVGVMVAVGRSMPVS